MIRRVLLILLFSSVHIPLIFSQIKNYIPIVKPVQYEKTKETFENIAEKFEQKDHHDLAEIFRSFAMGGHGSGFVYVDADGENYIITNRHVIANSEFVNLEFIGKGSTKTVYESCPIVYSDNEIDLAVVKFPDHEKVFSKSFSISADKQPDGEEIWSAGFPGLLGKPMWQFAKGNITNEEAYVDQLMDPSISYLIQHSASIDPGNSGGPLVVKDGNGAEGYSVIGINTWTITNRQNTFFAIPSKNIPALINKARQTIALQQSKDALRSALISQCEIFAAEINSDKPKWDNVLANISYSFAGQKGWDSFLRMLRESDSETLKLVESRFFDYSPIEAMRYSILYQMWKRVYSTKNDLSSIKYKGINAADEGQFALAKPIRANFTINGKDQEVEWIFEHGHWRISNYDLDKNAVQEKESAYDYKSYTSDKTESDSEHRGKKEKNNSVYFGITAFGTPYSMFSDADLNKNFNVKGFGGGVNFSVRGITLFARVNSFGLDNKMKDPPPTSDKVSVKFLQVSQGLMIHILKTKLSPYILVAHCYTKFSETGKYKTLTKTNTYEYLGLQGGFGLRYQVNEKWGVFCEGSYYIDWLLPKTITEDGGIGPFNTYTQNLSNFQAHAGIRFELRKKETKEK